MIDESNIKTTDWLTRGMTAEQIQKEKEKAIKQAEKELARLEKKKRKNSMRAFHKMRHRHRKELIKLVKQIGEWDYGWLDELVLMQIKHMHEYFSAGNNVWQTDETRLPIVEQLKYVLDLYEELDAVGDDASLNYVQMRQKEHELIEKIYSYIGSTMEYWWD